MPALKCLFLGYLWPLAEEILGFSGIVLAGCGVEPQRSKSKEMIDFCVRKGMPWFDARNISRNAEFDKFAAQGIDLIVVGAFGQLLNKKILGIPHFGVLNFHPSLLPAYKGGSPIEEQILSGDRCGGVTFHWMTEQVDEGPIATSDVVNIGPDDDYQTVLNNCVGKAKMLLRDLLLRSPNDWPKKEQPLSKQTIFSPRQPEDGIIDWRVDALKIYRLILALGWRGWVRSALPQGELIIRKAKVSSLKMNGAPGEVLAVNPNPIIACGNGAIELLEYSLPRVFIKGEVLV